MTNEKLFEVLGDISEKHIQEAHMTTAKHSKSVWIKLGMTAACLTIAIYMGTKFLPQSIPEDTSELPILAIGEDTSGAWGYEGYMAYDISELVNGNPWSESMEFSTLPVYRNPLTYDANFIASGVDWDKMRVLLLDVAERLGIAPEQVTITDNGPDEETKQEITEMIQKKGETVPDEYFDSTELIFEADDFKIEVEQYLMATVTFSPAISLPEKYDFSYYAPYEDMTDVAEYLKTEYSELLGMNDPQVNVYGGDYDIYNNQRYSIRFFDMGETETEQILNYNFNRVVFYCDEEGKLNLVRIYQPDLSQKVEDYPVISLEQAQKLLINGNYISSVPYEIPGAEYVKKVELIYRTGEHEAYYIPYYRFYVELPEDERENGMKTYGAYYVPAISGEYISDFPIWDGSFD